MVEGVKKLICDSTLLPNNVIQTTPDCLTPFENKSPQQMLELFKNAVEQKRLFKFAKWAFKDYPVTAFQDPDLNDPSGTNPKSWIIVHLEKTVEGAQIVFLDYYFTGSSRTWIKDPSLIDSEKLKVALEARR
ncbi:MAG: hypothetical protein Q7T03_00335 [Deltaproteobacteria bacterium]|nr:hypothetical protein [Deltaproteobacteria bacterium]